jgi:type II restriction enzyme
MFGRKNNQMKTNHLEHLKSSHDLETTYEAIRAGFVALALEKNRRATPFVAQARSLKVAASKAKIPGDLLKMTEIRPAVLTAAGVSTRQAITSRKKTRRKPLKA